MPEPMNKTEALARLDGLIAANASYKEGEIALLLAEAPAEWDRAIRALGRKEAYGHIADVLCAEYKSRIGREFLFTEACVAYELGYHINAYLWCKGFQGYPRHVTHLLFSKASLDRHCRSVEISESDLRSFKQRTMFRYKKGLRNKEGRHARQSQ